MKKKYFRNSVTLIICFILTLNVNSFSILAQTPNVELYSAKVMQKGFNSDYTAKGYIHVKNLDYDKTVTVNYTIDGTNWLEQKAEYFKNLSAEDEVWSFNINIPKDQSNNCTFAIKYEVAGNTYWDNNNGDNYYVEFSYSDSNTPYALSKSVVMLDTGKHNYRYGTQGFMFLKDLDYAKDVKVHYTKDNWTTEKSVDAKYRKDVGNNIESWEFFIPCYYYEEGEYAISYTVNGETYWDNNFGDNYSLTEYYE
ncbi:carbohydrate-binding protein [Vallitalea sediminicola]